MKPQLRTAAVALFLGAVVPSVAGCSGLAPVESPRTEVFAPYPAEQIEHAILIALTRKGWSVVARTPGAITAQITQKALTAQVQIRFNAAGWVIDRLDTSPQFKFRPHEGTAGYIHRRYNQWVIGLDREIHAALTTTFGPPAVQQPVTAPGAVPPGTPPAGTAAQPAGTGQPGEAAQPAQPGEAAQPAQPGEATQPAQPGEATQPAQPLPAQPSPTGAQPQPAPSVAPVPRAPGVPQ